jgi:DNA-directed RNA polymerase subunit M/transcription elongation factor TFIIS
MSRILQISDPDLYRTNIRNKLNQYFTDDKHGINLEIGIHNWTIKEATNKKIIKKWDNSHFICIYNSRLKTIKYNLEKNSRLIEMVENGSIKSQEIAFMTHQEMCPDKWDEKLRRLKLKEKTKFEQNKQSKTDVYTCRKCKSNNCDYYEMQTRSADEPMTIFIWCNECGFRWKR